MSGGGSVRGGSFRRLSSWFGLLLALGAVELILPVESASGFTLSLFNVPPFPPNAITSLSDGEAIPLGSGIVAGGFFTISDTAIQGATSIRTLADAFVQFGNADTMNGGGFGHSGLYAFNTTALISPDVNAHFIGQTVYTFIGNAATYSLSEEVLVYKHVGLIFDKGPTPGVSAMVSEFQLEPRGQLLVGTFRGPDVDQGFGPIPSFQLAVPEVSRGLLAVLSFSLLALRRGRTH